MKYLLFISYNNGLMHNAVYENIFILQDSVAQLVEEEELEVEAEKIPSFDELKEHFKKEDDFFKELSNGTWFHIQEFSERNYIKDVLKEFVEN